MALEMSRQSECNERKHVHRQASFAFEVLLTFRAAVDVAVAVELYPVEKSGLRWKLAVRDPVHLDKDIELLKVTAGLFVFQVA
ncbi:MAG: hypothetical protein IPG56_08450 [Caulobacteraceae bacterium]|nr:hypothetical protein [Caulobacteraceae bacterium]